MGRNNELLNPLVGDVPYLNGGLFEKTDQDRADFTIDDAAFTKIWDNLFSRYNFTVAESTPDDQDVAVDPEMLGKVFEELVTGRHESGSYYTPRPIVQFMCREALKGYLAPCGSGIEEFVDFHDASGITNHEAVLAALRSVKVVDPACGSGAYLLGMLQELMALRLSLFNAKRLDDKLAYARKLEIIQNNLYGVDLDAFAVNTARLRLWLSLVVEDQRNPLVDRNAAVALPNLDFKIEQGDSVCCPDPSGGLQLDLFRENDLRELAAKQRQHGDVNYHGDKHALKREIDALAKAIKVESKLDENAFDWRVDFGGVFQKQEPVADLGGALNLGGTLAAPAEAGGFDVVLANPPFVNMVAMEASNSVYREFLRKRYASATGGFDLFIPFMERGVQLLREGGSMVYITPNKLLSAEYAANLRKILTSAASLKMLVDLSAVPVFGAAVYPFISIVEKARTQEGFTRFYRSHSGSVSDVEIEFVHSVPFAVTKATSGLWSPLAYEGIAELAPAFLTTLTIGTVAEVSGAATVSEAYEWKEAVIDSGAHLLKASPQRYARFIVSGNIRRYFDTWDSSLVQYIKQGYSKPVVDCDHPAISSRRNKQIRSEKVIISGMSKRPTCCWGSGDVAAGKSTILVVPKKQQDGLFLMALLNSETMQTIYRVMFGSLSLAGGFLRFGPPQISALPVPNANADERTAIAELVQQCIDLRGKDISDLEREIDRRVAALYGLT